MGESLYQLAPLCPLACNVRRCDGLRDGLRAALLPGALTQSLGVADDVHAAVVAVLLYGSWLLNECHSAVSPKEGLQLAGDAAGVQGVAAALRVVVRESGRRTPEQQQAPMRAAGRLVGVVVDGQEDQAAGGQTQGLQEECQLLLARGALDELRDFGTNEAGRPVQALEALGGEVLKGEANHLVVQPVRPLQQGHV